MMNAETLYILWIDYFVRNIRHKPEIITRKLK
jgi:hypothetical protein